MMRKVCLTAGLCVAALIGNIAWAADEEKPKQVIKGNNFPEYLVLPQPVDNFRDAFLKGMYYGRLRSNLFYYYYDEETSSQKDNRAFGLGGSITYKTAPLKGVSGTAGIYTSQNPIESINMDKEDAVKYVKSGKDTFSRGKLYDNGSYDGHWGMTTVAESYLEYKDFGFDVKYGRQIYESFLTNSNDSKMIPNTFEGLTIGNTSIPATTISAAYLTHEKLRDHEDFHDVIAYEKYYGNDDSGAHLGLTKNRLNAEDIDTELLVLGINNKSLKDLMLDANATIVPDLFWTGMIEANYQISLGDGWTLTPGFRYLQQFDDGAGDIGGAAISGKMIDSKTGRVHEGKYLGYDDADSVDGSMWGGRLVLKKGAGSLSAGYTSVADKADLIAPWRGFPTGGYTRDIAQVNWEANTDSWMIKYDYDFDKAGLVWGLKAALDYTYMNYDETKEVLKSLLKTDADIIHLDLWQDIPHVPGLRAVVRVAKYMADDRKSDGVDPSYWEWRFGLDYLF